MSRFAELSRVLGRAASLAGTIAATIALMLAASSTRALAQTLTPKRTLTTGVAVGCDVTVNSVPRIQRANAEARRLVAEAQEAALLGDRAAARAAFMRASIIAPADDRIAYDLGRIHEEAGDTTGAIGEYCRYLALTPEGEESADVRGRLPRLVPREATLAAERTVTSFRDGLRLYDARRFDAAADAFTATLRISPTAPEALFNRALARAAAGRRSDAASDFQSYLTVRPAADDRVVVARNVAVLNRPEYSAASAFTRGLLPGFGQFYTRRPGSGMLVLALTAGAAAVGLYQRTSIDTIPYLDPNGVSVPYTETKSERPFLVPAITGAAVLTLGAAIEAAQHARSTRGPVARVSAYVGPRGNVGLRYSAKF